jgi:flagellar basal-body rod modification protein FlgD
MSTSISTISSLLQSTNSSTTSSSTGTSGLDVDDFLQLLVAQMQNQDPLGSDSSGGSSNTDYIAQLAQFTMLEQLTNLNTAFTANKAYSLIGKYVYLNDSSSTDLILGKVDGVVEDDGTYYLVVGGKNYDLSEVTAVVNDSSDVDNTILNSANLVGKKATAVITGSDGTETTVTGVVEKVTIKDGLAYVTINDQSIPLSSITEITSADSDS